METQEGFLTYVQLIFLLHLEFTAFYVQNSQFGRHLKVKGTVMQIEEAPVNDRLHISKVSCKFRIPTKNSFCSNLPVKFAIFFKSSLLFNSFYCLFCL